MKEDDKQCAASESSENPYGDELDLSSDDEDDAEEGVNAVYKWKLPRADINSRSAPRPIETFADSLEFND